MKYYVYIFSALSTLLLNSSCAKIQYERVDRTENLRGDYIFFEPSVKQTVSSKANIVDGTSLPSTVGTAFGVMGTYGKNSTSVFTESTDGIVQVARNSEGFFSYNSLVLWVDDKTEQDPEDYQTQYVFNAFYPYSLKDQVKTTEDNTPYLSYTQPNSINDMNDVLTANVKTNKVSVVLVNFVHRLFALDVIVKNSQTEDVPFYNNGTTQYLSPKITIESLKIEFSELQESNVLYFDGTIGEPQGSVTIQNTFTDEIVLKSDEEVTINGNNSFLLLPCNSLKYRLTINFKNAWGVPYTYHYPETYLKDDEGNMLPDKNGNIQWEWMNLSREFKAGYRYNITINKIQSNVEFTFDCIETQWGEWDEETQKWINIDVNHTFE